MQFDNALGFTSIGFPLLKKMSKDWEQKVRLQTNKLPILMGEILEIKPAPYDQLYLMSLDMHNVNQSWNRKFKCINHKLVPPFF